MTERRFRIFTDLKTNEENIVDMIKGEPLTINETCKLLNSLDEENQAVKKVLQKYLDIYTKRALVLKEPYGDVTEAIHDIADELRVDLE